MDGMGTALPVQHLAERIGNDRASIEAAAKAPRRGGLYGAIRASARSTSSAPARAAGRKRRPERCQMKADRAKQLAGRYAVCRRVGDRLLPVAGTHERLEDANAQWRQRRDYNLVVACCNRLDRCWEVPRFNPLYAEFDPWLERTATAASQPPEAEPQEAPAAQAALSAGFLPTKSGEEPGAPSPGEDDWQYLPGANESDDLDDSDNPDEEEDEEQQP
jgi:hypothetical protein